MTNDPQNRPNETPGQPQDKPLVQKLLPAVIIVVALLLGWGIMQKKPPKRRPPAEKPAILVETVHPVTGTTVFVYALGNIQTLEQIDLRAEVQGRVAYVAQQWQAGGRFAAHDVLLKIESTAYEMALQKARAALAETQSNYDQEMGRKEIAALEWSFADTSVSTELDRARALRVPQRQAIEAALRSAKTGVLQAEQDLSRTSIRLPWPGTVLSTMVRPGSYVRIGESLGEVFSDSLLRIQGTLPPGVSQYVHRGDTARVVVGKDRNGKITVPAEVLSVLPVAESGVQQPQFVLSLPKNKQILQYNLLTEVQIPLRVPAGILGIPTTAITMDGQVWTVVDRGKGPSALQIPITILHQGKQMSWVGGLRPDQAVITQNNLPLFDGVALRAVQVAQ